jgi:SAM-dependent methyltransferase
MGLYERFVLAPLIDCGCGVKPIRYQRRKIVPQASGVVLELGFGTGHNLPFYDPERVSKLVALEPEPAMLSRARKAALGARVPVKILAEKAEDMSLPPKTVDTVLVTYALCTIPNPAAALAGARRVLKPSGRLLFCEHGRAPDAAVARTQARIEPLWKRVFGGCHLTRDIPALIEAAGFEMERLETMYLPSTPRFAGFNYWGAAKIRA